MRKLWILYCLIATLLSIIGMIAMASGEWTASGNFYIAAGIWLLVSLRASGR